VRRAAAISLDVSRHLLVSFGVRRIAQNADRRPDRSANCHFDPGKLSNRGCEEGPGKGFDVGHRSDEESSSIWDGQFSGLAGHDSWASARRSTIMRQATRSVTQFQH